MTTFHLDCQLDYEVRAQWVFVFNLGVAPRPRPRVLAESFSTIGALEADEFLDEIGHNRFHRVNVPPGPFGVW